MKKNVEFGSFWKEGWQHSLPNRRGAGIRHPDPAPWAETQNSPPVKRPHFRPKKTDPGAKALMTKRCISDNKKFQEGEIRDENVPGWG